MKSWKHALLAVYLLPMLAAAAAAAEPSTQPAKPQYLRFVEDEAGNARLEAAVVTFRKGDVTVDLYSAVHVAEQSFYETLNRDFARYDAVLYEMVKPRGMQPMSPRDMAESSRGGISALHRIMQRATQLAFQMDVVDYTPDHFVHADLDWDTFAEAMQTENELSGILLRSYAAASAGEQTTSVAPEVLVGQFLLAAADPKQARALKYMLAQEFADVDRMAAPLHGPDGGVLLGKRNQAAIDALQQTVRDGKKHLALFYGAAHMSDLAQRLEQLGYTPTTTRYLTAWDIPAPSATQPATAQP
jgi:hypothetical protein